MTLRLLLVSAVASMGLNLPDGRDVEDLQRKCRSAWAAGLARWDAMMPVGELAFGGTDSAVDWPVWTEAEPATATRPSADDAAFAAVVEGMADAFAAEAPAVEAPSDEPAAAAMETLAAAEIEGEGVGAIEPGDDLYPGIAFELNRASEGLGRVEPWSVASAPAPEPAPTVATPASGRRFRAAVRLTAEAVQAWVTLVQAPSDLVAAD